MTLMRMLSTLLVLTACTPSDDDPALKKRRPDAAVTSTIDAPTSPTSSPEQSGVVTCYRENDPAATCTSPQFCCWSNYSSANSGECRSDSCAWGTILCDGPEDCGAGAHCCSHAIVDPVEGIQGYMLACQTSACGAPPAENELCHPSTGCGDSRSCVTAYGNANSLPRTLYVCR
jgi:hypothetical protein